MLQNSTLTKLNLSSNLIGSEGAISLANALKQNTTLKTLLLRNNQIGPEGTIALANTLKQNKSLIKLQLNSNNIGMEGAHALSSALRNNTTLTTLELYNNGIKSEGATTLANALKQNTTLTALNLNSNQIGDEGAIEIVKIVNKNSTLLALYLKNNIFTPHLENLMDLCIERNREGHQRAKKAVLQLLKLAGTPTIDLEVDDHEKLSDFFSNLILTNKIDKKSYFTQMARELWKTRAEPIWWTPEERKEAGLQTEDELQPQSKRRGIESCIQCKVAKPKFREEGAPSRVFCGSYCQWIKYSRAPDLRGKTPEEIQAILQN